MQPHFPMNELNQIESAIQASQQWLATLTLRRDALNVELDRLTRPEPSPMTARAKTIGPGVDFQGLLSIHWTGIDIHIALLRRLWTTFPERRDAMSEAMSRCSKSRAYVAKTRLALFQGKPLSWIHQHSRAMVDGWFVDTNLSIKQMNRILPVAVAAAGLTWNDDVKVYWRSTPVVP